MSAAKLYRVHVTQIRGGFRMAEVTDCWVAAVSRAEAIKTVKDRLYITVPAERLHIHCDCYRGRLNVISNTELRVKP